MIFFYHSQPSSSVASAEGPSLATHLKQPLLLEAEEAHWDTQCQLETLFESHQLGSTVQLL